MSMMRMPSNGRAILDSSVGSTGNWVSLAHRERRVVARNEPEISLVRGGDRNQAAARCNLECRVAEPAQKGEGVVEPIAGALQMRGRQLDQQMWAESAQRILRTTQQGKLPAFDIGLNQIDAVESERHGDRVDSGHRYQLLRDSRPALLR